MKNEILFLLSINFLFVAFSCKSKYSMMTSNFPSNYQQKIDGNQNVSSFSNLKLVQKKNIKTKKIQAKQDEKNIQNCQKEYIY